MKCLPWSLLVSIVLSVGLSAQEASVTHRNGGSNHDVYVISGPPILGKSLVAAIHCTGLGCDQAWLAGYSNSLSLSLGPQRTVLVGFLGAELMGLSPIPCNPTGAVAIDIPAHPALIGYELSTQAAIYSSADPGSTWALTNAYDFVLGTPPGLAVDMVLVPGGEYEMGDHHDGFASALPVHTVNISAFWMDKYEVTNAQYCAFLNEELLNGSIAVDGDDVELAANGRILCTTTGFGPNSRIIWDGTSFSVVPGKEDHPMVMVTWNGAAHFANWRSTRDGLVPCYNMATMGCSFGANGYRLPTEAEWEKAARGGEHGPYYRYPWGDGIEANQANYASSNDPFDLGPNPRTTPVAYYDGNQVPSGPDMANGYGLYDMAGNVWEHCNDRFDGAYYGVSSYQDPRGPSSGPDQSRVIRGGGWVHDTPLLSCAFRSNCSTGWPSYFIGFRLVAANQ